MLGAPRYQIEILGEHYASVLYTHEQQDASGRGGILTERHTVEVYLDFVVIFVA